MKHSLPPEAPVLSVVLNWNGKSTLAATLDTLTKQTAKNHKVLVIDNGSIDGSAQLVELYEGVDLLALDKNYGFARGNNFVFDWPGWGEADWENGWIFFSNNDVIYDENIIAILRKTGENIPDAVSISPLINYVEPANRLWFGGAFAIPWIGLVGHKRMGQKFEKFNDDQIETTDYATACSVLIPAKYFKAVGGFDVGYPHYAEDLDLSFRLKRRFGGKCYLLRNVLAIHQVSASLKGSTRKDYLRSMALGRWLWREMEWGAPFAAPGMISWLMLAGLYRRGIGGAWQALKGWWKGFRSLGDPISWGDE